MANLINRDSFTATGETITHTTPNGYSYSYTLGTVEVTLRGQTRRVEAKRFGEDDIVAYGMVGRYHTSAKLWPAYVSSDIRNGAVIEEARFGRDDNHPKFRKENYIWFAE